MSTHVVLAMAGAFGLSIGAALGVLWRLSVRPAHWESLIRRLDRSGSSEAASGPGPSPQRRSEPRLTALAVLALMTTLGVIGGGCVSFPIGGVVGGAGAAVLTSLARLSAVNRRRTATVKAFREFMRDLQITTASGELASQAVSLSACRVQGDLRLHLDRALAAHRAGTPLFDAVSGIPELESCPDYAGLIQAIWLHEEAGASLAELVGAAVDRSEEVMLMQGDVAAKVADAKWTARILAVVPPGLVAYLLLFESWALTPLTDDAAGRAALLVGSALWLAGIVVIWRLTLVPAEFAGPS